MGILNFLQKIFAQKNYGPTVTPSNPQVEKKNGFKIAASTGLYRVAADPQLQTLSKKVGYVLTRGVSAIDIASDIFNEINYSEGAEIRYISKKQNVDLTLHGSLAVPMEIPDRSQWREAQDHIQGGIKSAILGGCKLINFHASLNIWLEMISYAGRRLEVLMCDWDGNPIRKIVTGKKEVIDWIVENEYDSEIGTLIWYPRREELTEFIDNAKKELEKLKQQGQTFTEEQENQLIKNKVVQYHKQKIREVLENPEAKWFSEIGAARGEFIPAYKILLHVMWLTNDPIWQKMTQVEPYKRKLEAYNYSFAKPVDEKKKWLSEAIDKAFDREDYFFKEFFYGTVAAKFLQRHIMKAFEWMQGKEDEDLPQIIKKELQTIGLTGEKFEEEWNEFQKYIRELTIGIEIPDAREPDQAGRYLLWRPRQIYVALKSTREALRESNSPYADKVYFVWDFEQLATQGVDPLIEVKEAVKIFDDLGEITKMIHANYPTPLHAHKPIDIGDRLMIYRLLWELRKTGLGKKESVYLLFERGGGDDPFRGSIIALRTIAMFLEDDVEPDKLPPTFFGIAEGTRDYARQKVAVFQHAFDPLKGMLKQPEEEHTLLSTAAIKAGKRPEEWLKEELR